MTPLQFHTALQGGLFVLQNGFYVYQGDDADASLYLTKEEGDALLSSYADGAQAKEASAVASASEGPIKTGLFGTAKAYVEKIGDKSSPANPLEDYESYQSVNVALLEDPDATPADTAYVKDILARKIKANKYAQDNKDQLTNQQKADAELLANTAVDEIDYAGPKVLKEIIAEGDTATKEAALVFTNRVISGELDGEVNTISEEGKGKFAVVVYDFLKSDARHEIAPEIAQTSYRAVVVYYSSHPEIAVEQGVDLPLFISEVGSSLRAGTDQAESHSFDDSSSIAGRMGVATADSGGAGRANGAGVVDPVALTTASLQAQNSIAANESAASDSEAVPSSTTSVPLSSDIEAPPIFGGWLLSGTLAAVPAGDPILQYADFELVRSDSSFLAEKDFPARAIPTGVAAYYEPIMSGPAAEQVNAAASLPQSNTPGAYQVFISESGALRVHGETAAAVAQRSEDRILDQERRAAASERLNQVFFESPAECALDGGLGLWVGEIQDGDATTIAGLIATDPNVGGFAGLQSATISTQHFVRSNTLVAATGTKSSLDGVAKKSESPSGGDHQGRDKEDGDRSGGQGGQSDDSHYTWYETPQDEADDQSKAA